MGFGPCRQRMQPLRNEPYLVWVRHLPCCGCGKEVGPLSGVNDAHHCIADRESTGKASDYHTFPLCVECHNDLHRGPGGWPAWEERNGSQWLFVARTLDLAMRNGVFDFNKRQGVLSRS